MKRVFISLLALCCLTALLSGCETPAAPELPSETAPPDELTQARDILLSRVEDWRYTDYAGPVSGDLDGDGDPEQVLVGWGWSYGAFSAAIYVFTGEGDFLTSLRQYPAYGTLELAQAESGVALRYASLLAEPPVRQELTLSIAEGFLFLTEDGEPASLTPDGVVAVDAAQLSAWGDVPRPAFPVSEVLQGMVIYEKVTDAMLDRYLKERELSGCTVLRGARFAAVQGQTALVVFYQYWEDDTLFATASPISVTDDPGALTAEQLPDLFQKEGLTLKLAVEQSPPELFAQTGMQRFLTVCEYTTDDLYLGEKLPAIRLSLYQVLAGPGGCVLTGTTAQMQLLFADLDGDGTQEAVWLSAESRDREYSWGLPGLTLYAYRLQDGVPVALCRENTFTYPGDGVFFVTETGQLLLIYPEDAEKGGREIQALVTVRDGVPTFTVDGVPCEDISPDPLISYYSVAP